MGFMRPSTPRINTPVKKTIPVKSESVQADSAVDYQARENRRQGMVSTILSKRQQLDENSDESATLLRKTLG